MFGCQKFGNFSEKNGIFEITKFSQKSSEKKFGNLKSKKSLDIKRNCTSISKISKKLCKVGVFESKKPVFGSKSSESLEKFRKVWKSSEKVWKVRKQGFQNVRKFWKF